MLILGHALFAICFIPYVVFYFWKHMLSQQELPDYLCYYAGAYFARFDPQHLYSFAAQSALYTKLYHLPSLMQTTAYFFYLAPPFFAVLLRPLTWIDYSDGYLLFNIISYACALPLMRNIGRIARSMGLADQALFFQSCVFGTMSAAIVFGLGQWTIILTFLFSEFLRAAEDRKTFAGLLLALMLIIKFQLFLPMVAYMAGCRQWRMLATTTLICAATVALSLYVLNGVGSWIDWLHAIAYYNTGLGEMGYVKMISLRGILANMPDDRTQYHPAIALVTIVGYICINAVCLGWPFMRKDGHVDRIALMLLTPWCFFLSSYFQVHDAMLLLPAAMALTALLRVKKQGWLMIVVYLLASYIMGPVIHWSMRAMMILLCGLSVGALRIYRRKTIAID